MPFDGNQTDRVCLFAIELVTFLSLDDINTPLSFVNVFNIDTLGFAQYTLKFAQSISGLMYKKE